MKYALLIYGNDTEWESRSEEEKQAIYGEYMQVSESPGVFGGSELQPGDTATTVRSQNGDTLDRKSTRLNSSHTEQSRMPSSA